MIKYSLICSNGHSFDSWFDGRSAFEKLERAGMLSCAICGSSNVKRALMSPRVNNSAKPENDKSGPLSAPASTAEQAFKELRKKIESETEDVGHDFARQARQMHDGKMHAKAIRGKAKAADAKALLRDGVPILPLPWGQKKTN